MPLKTENDYSIILSVIDVLFLKIYSIVPLFVPAYDTILAFRLLIDRFIGNFGYDSVKALLRPPWGTI